jgi:hypothetical protein
MNDNSIFVGPTHLKRERGWTDAALKRFLDHRGGSGRVYSLQQIKEIEMTMEFQA